MRPLVLADPAAAAAAEGGNKSTRSMRAIVSLTGPLPNTTVKTSSAGRSLPAKVRCKFDD